MTPSSALPPMPIPTAQVHALMWFRQDLRLGDNQAFTASCEWARAKQARLKAIYIATPAQWALHDVAPIQLDFIERHLNILAKDLAALGIELEVITLASFADIPDFLKSYCQTWRVEAVFAGAQPEINERRRDEACMQAGVPLKLTLEHCLLPPGSVLTQSGEMYRVFTPFSRRWRALGQSLQVLPLGVPSPMGPKLPLLPAIVLPLAVRVSSDAWAAGEDAALQRLRAFVAQKAHEYQRARDFPATSGTSSLSPYLAIGVLSPRQCVAALLQRFPEAMVDDTSPGWTWLNELIWREFYRHLLVAFPDLSKNH
ncbi:MAG: deoxyribodipyrimidine photo-lyase, partial [Shewanella sp.]